MTEMPENDLDPGGDDDETVPPSLNEDVPFAETEDETED